MDDLAFGEKTEVCRFCNAPLMGSEQRGSVCNMCLGANDDDNDLEDRIARKVENQPRSYYSY